MPCLGQEHAGGIQVELPGPRDGLEIQVVDHGLDGKDYRDDQINVFTWMAT